MVGVGIKETLEIEFPGMSITNHVWTVVSVTTGSTQNVANQFENTPQADCVMHSCKLLLKYSMGIKENHVADPIAGIRSILMPRAQGVA
eukprot:2105139-Ditylum_brightwellii.AAC.1